MEYGGGSDSTGLVSFVSSWVSSSFDPDPSSPGV